MKRIYVGIDISKGWLDYAECDDEALLIEASKNVDNTIKGIKEMLKFLLKRYTKEQLWFCFEHTGNYGLLLCSILQTKELIYSMVPAIEIKKSSGITRGKTDPVDAVRIAKYAATYKNRLKVSKLPSEDLMRVKNLLAYRAQLTKTKSGFINSSKSYKEAEKVVELNFIRKDLDKKIKQLKKDIKAIDQKIMQVINESKGLNKNYHLITSVKGIGLVIAAFMLVHTNNFNSFDNPRKFNCFTGLAPFETSSGLYKGRSKTSHYRHKYLKSLLFNGANSAAMYDPQLRQYYTRKTKEGKQHLSIINAIACKIVYRAFATIKRQTPYVILAQ
jgi:transposase